MSKQPLSLPVWTDKCGELAMLLIIHTTASLQSRGDCMFQKTWQRAAFLVSPWKEFLGNAQNINTFPPCHPTPFVLSHIIFALSDCGLDNSGPQRQHTGPCSAASWKSRQEMPLWLPPSHLTSFHLLFGYLHCGFITMLFLYTQDKCWENPSESQNKTFSNDTICCCFPCINVRI